MEADLRVIVSGYTRCRNGKEDSGCTSSPVVGAFLCVGLD